MDIILASKSPRRKELLSSVCDEFKILTSATDETLPAGMHPREGVGVLAERKGRAVYDEYRDTVGQALIISSDTLVEADGEPLGKPASREHAAEMLSLLSGREHNVHTGIAVRVGERCVCGVATTAVRFKELSDEEINAYIETGEPMDKAGSYGIQGLGGKFVLGIEGDFDTVVGFSLKLLFELLGEIGISTEGGRICL